MKYEKLIDVVRHTDIPAEMIAIGKAIVEKCPEIYTPLMRGKLSESIEHHIPDASEATKEEMLYQSIYDYWVHGCDVDQEFYLGFDTKTDDEKQEYMAICMLCKYIDHLNSGGGEAIYNILCDKYFLYNRLKPYYLRDMIEIKDEADYPAFEAFAKAHGQFVVKPVNFRAGYGVHKASLRDFNNDALAAFHSILGEGEAIHRRHASKQPRMVLEELIIQDPALAILHPNSINAVRATAVRGKDGKIHLFHPWIKVGMNGTFVASAALDGFDAEIDSETGSVITDGYQESGKVVSVHPDSGIQIKGFQIPRWQEMISFVEELMDQMPEFGYIGWDLVLTPKGWCVMEGNYWGGFMFQMINGRGYRKEFEELIGWKFDKEYWWMDESVK